MSANPVKQTGGRQTLSAVLQRAHFRVAMIAVLLAGLSVFVVGLLILRAYMIDNLGLSARAIAYTVEAAMVFDNRDAAGESLSLIAADNPIAVALVLDRVGNEFAGWKRPATEPFAALEDVLARLVLTEPAEAAIIHDGARIGTVRIYGSGRDLLKYLWISLVCALLGLALSAAAAFRLSWLASQTIIEPLQRLASTVSGARRERQFSRRVAPVDVLELQDLGDDVNALLEELERWQAQVESESASLEHQANHDPLTGLANRARFESRLQEALFAARDKGTRVALFFIDADRFKAVNDQFGHEAGDAVLAAIARRLKAQVRRDGDLVARLGGDEFAVLLTSLREAEQAGRIAANMLGSMESPIALPGGGSIISTLSIGIAFYPEHAADAAGLLKRADDAMYQAKRTKAGSYHLVQTSEIDELQGENQ